jgi:hypothetical protein
MASVITSIVYTHEAKAEKQKSQKPDESVSMGADGSSHARGEVIGRDPLPNAKLSMCSGNSTPQPLVSPCVHPPPRQKEDLPRRLHRFSSDPNRSERNHQCYQTTDPHLEKPSHRWEAGHSKVKQNTHVSHQKKQSDFQRLFRAGHPGNAMQRGMGRVLVDQELCATVAPTTMSCCHRRTG